MSVTSDFTGTGQGSIIFVPIGDSFTWEVSGTFVGSSQLEMSDNNGITWTPIVKDITSAASGEVIAKARQYRFTCTDYTSGTIVTSLKQAVDKHEIFTDRKGRSRIAITDQGVKVFGVISNEETGDLGGTSQGTIDVVESGVGGFHQTKLTLTETPLEVSATSTANGVGGVKIYDLPAGHIHSLGAVATLSISCETTTDFTDATPEGDIGIGTVAPANADALGTDATDDNIGTAEAFTMASHAVSGVEIAPELNLNIDGTGTAADVYLNALIDAADIDDDATTNLLVSGTITLNWIYLGNH